MHRLLNTFECRIASAIFKANYAWFSSEQALQCSLASLQSVRTLQKDQKDQKSNTAMSCQKR